MKVPWSLLQVSHGAFLWFPCEPPSKNPMTVAARSLGDSHYRPTYFCLVVARSIEPLIGSSGEPLAGVYGVFHWNVCGSLHGTLVGISMDPLWDLHGILHGAFMGILREPSWKPPRNLRGNCHGTFMGSSWNLHGFFIGIIGSLVMPCAATSMSAFRIVPRRYLPRCVPRELQHGA
jgi:hypothetical protein